jgi:hypothetical protein
LQIPRWLVGLCYNSRTVRRTLCSYLVPDQNAVFVCGSKDDLFRSAGGNNYFCTRNRVTPVNHTRYAVVDPEERCASSRAEEARSVSQKNSPGEFFCETDKKCTMRPQAILPFSG